MSQFKAFVKAAEAARRIEQAGVLQSVAIGSQGDGKSIKKTLDSLLHGNS